jgi:hypothetical protein
VALSSVFNHVRRQSIDSVLEVAGELKGILNYKKGKSNTEKRENYANLRNCHIIHIINYRRIYFAALEEKSPPINLFSCTDHSIGNCTNHY